MGKCALIVDDSKTSRVVLSRILETHALVVDTAVSAEDALDYLNGNRPDVIFMDHLMPGMDGLQAVEAIKKNPDTAMIPIMMYTSEKGDVYVGQARALGAVGVLPKEVEPVALSRILESLHLVGECATNEVSTQPSERREPVDDYPPLDSIDIDIRPLIDDLFDQQRAIMKSDLRRSSRMIAASVSDQIKRAAFLASSAVDQSLERRAKAWFTAAIVLGVIVVVMAISYALLNFRSQEIIRENAVLHDTVADMEDAVFNSELALRQQLDEQSTTAGSVSTATTAAMAWAFNRSAQYDYGQEPLGDYRVIDFEQLSRHLDAIEFEGQVLVETYVGEYCLVLGEQGYVLAPESLPATACDLRSLSYAEGLVTSERQSLAMAKFIASNETQSGGRIRYDVIPRGTVNPVRNYPVDVDNISAGDWNHIANTNNRISVTLLPDH